MTARRGRGRPITGTALRLYQSDLERTVVKHTVYIDGDLDDRLILFCEDEGLTLSEAIARSLRKTLPQARARR